MHVLLNRNPEMDEEHTPIVSIVIVADKNRCPPNFVPIVKAYDDGSDADLWKDGFGFGLFNRSVRYLAISRHIAETHGPLEVLIDLAVISDREAIPSNFIPLDFTVDSKEKALKKKYLCARFAPRSDCVDAVSNILILAKQKRPPKGYSQAGEIDGMMICHKISTIPESYGNSRLTHSQSTELDRLGNAYLHGSAGGGIGPHSHLYPNVNRHSTSDLDKMGQFSKTEKNPIHGGAGKIIDRIPFQLSPFFSIACTGKDLVSSLPPIPDIRALHAKYVYNSQLERSIASSPLTPTSPPPF